MGRIKGSKNKPKPIKSLQQLGEVMNHAMKDFVPAPTEKDFYDQPKLDEPAKYQTSPLSNWAIENRKKKLGLKD